ncbi:MULTISPECIES: type II toxin-antitoxin system RelE/ParE family toxin [Thalassospira]|uniref:Toxin n=2 Tax=Thalassospira TaxID=168934 RepID=A0A285RMF7_9PROT|nr:MULTISPECIES: type II toxin-antitoxin system RelE/ParE family toxin [Thalassospira]KEO52499.1 hypothetical protein SMB34_07610 [Thalassospira permensis NBRC 106175]SOB95044.1 toxin ParE1/3/4 [Thalassospira xiamenensis]
MAGNPGYRLSQKAEADLEEIWLYTMQRWSAAQADKYIRDFLIVFDDLAGGARSGQQCDIRDGYLKIAMSAHVIYYRQAGGTIEVVRILHGRMDVNRHL